MCSVVNEIILFGYSRSTRLQKYNLRTTGENCCPYISHQSGHKMSARVPVVHTSQCNMLSACSIKEEHNELHAHGMGIGV